MALSPLSRALLCNVDAPGQLDGDAVPGRALSDGGEQPSEVGLQERRLPVRAEPAPRRPPSELAPIRDAAVHVRHGLFVAPEGAGQQRLAPAGDHLGLEPLERRPLRRRRRKVQRQEVRPDVVVVVVRLTAGLRARQRLEHPPGDRLPGGGRRRCPGAGRAPQPRPASASDVPYTRPGPGRPAPRRHALRAGLTESPAESARTPRLPPQPAPRLAPAPRGIASAWRRRGGRRGPSLPKKCGR